MPTFPYHPTCCCIRFSFAAAVQSTGTPVGAAATPASSTKASAAAAAAETRRLRDALSRVAVMGSDVARGTFATKNLEQDLGRLLQVWDLAVHYNM